MFKMTLQQHFVHIIAVLQPRRGLAGAAPGARIPQREGALTIIAQGTQLTEGAVGWQELDAVPENGHGDGEGLVLVYTYIYMCVCGYRYRYIYI
jgi:hypothetical protein